MTGGAVVPVKASLEVVESIREGGVRCRGSCSGGFVFCDEVDHLTHAMRVRVVFNFTVVLSFSIHDGSPEFGPGCAVLLCIP